jgi:ATP-dependent RNA helicase DeaD
MAAPSDEDPTGFEQVGLRDELLAALSELGYEEPTPIQREALPPLLGGRDLVGQAATGTGKTAAFALPLLQRLEHEDRADAPMALVLVPTRELAMQVSQAIHRYGRQLGARVLPIYGGQPIWRQLKALERGVDVVVATPGRALDHLSRGTLDLGHLEVVVLDEADEMLDMGFAEDIDEILAEGPEYRQTMLFSATMPPRIAKLAKRHLHEPVRITLVRDAQEPSGTPAIEQRAYVVPRSHKPTALGRVLDIESPDAAIVFCRTRTQVDELTETMNGRGYRAEALHGGMTQEQRDRVMGRLRNQTADLLIATDVAARGLDVEHLTHVVNYDVPSAPEAYVHRIGRVGRAGREGVAIMLVEPREHRMLKAIERHTGSRIEVDRIPTVADLEARRLELTREALEESLLEGDLDRFRAVVEAVSDDHDIVEVALAAVKLAHEATVGTEDGEELPDVRLHEERPARRSGGQEGGQRRAKDRGGRRPPPAEMSRIYVGVGREAGIRPKDLVGAIANETSLAGRDIGTIEITRNFSLVEVPTPAMQEVISALGRSTIKGRKASIRPDRDTSGR